MMDMPVRTFNAYFRQIDKIEALEQLRELQIARVSRSRGSDVADLVRDLRRRATGEADKPRLITGPEDLERLFRGNF